jgi:hypothetical protein
MILHQVFLLLPQRGKLGGGKFSKPYDSTIGVGPGFYWFAAFFLAFICIGVAKAYWDDKEWRGRFFKLNKKRNSIPPRNP